MGQFRMVPNSKVGNNVKLDPVPKYGKKEVRKASHPNLLWPKIEEENKNPDLDENKNQYLIQLSNVREKKLREKEFTDELKKRYSFVIFME